MKLQLAYGFSKTGVAWPEILPDPPSEAVEMVENAMLDFGPDATDGAAEIAALLIEWARKNPRSVSRETDPVS